MSNKIKINNICFDNYTLAKASEVIISDIINNTDLKYALTLNLDYLKRIKSNKQLKSIFNKASYILPDGMPIVWASKISGRGLKERVTGCDLGELLVKKAVKNKLKVFLLATNSLELDVAQKAIDQFKFKNSSKYLKGYTQKYEITKKGEIDLDALKIIKKFKPDILLVGFGCPYQDIVINNYQSKLNISFSMGVGGSIDVWSNYKSRAPVWMRNSGLEWLYQIYLKPKKVFRYLSNLPIFFQIIGSSIVKRFKDKF